MNTTGEEQGNPSPETQEKTEQEWVETQDRLFGARDDKKPG